MSNLLVTDVYLPEGINRRQIGYVVRTKSPDLKVLFITDYADTR